MKSNKYKSSKNKGYKSSNKINPEFFRKNINEAKKLYDPLYGDINKGKNPKNRYNQFNFNAESTRNYLQFKQILNNYMLDYEKLRKQNKLPKYQDSKYSFQEFEAEKNNVKELFDSFFELNGKDEFNDTDYIIRNLPEDYDNMLLKNDITKKDYNMRYKIIKGDKLQDQEEEKDYENIDNQDNNKLNQNCYIENNEEEEEAENEEENYEINNKNINIIDNINNNYNNINKNIENGNNNTTEEKNEKVNNNNSIEEEKEKEEKKIMIKIIKKK